MLKRWMAVVILTIGCGSASAQDVIKLRADTWCPYNCDPIAVDPGYLIEIARAAFARHGHKVDYMILPWTRTLTDVRSGEIDGAVGAALDDAPDLVFPSVPLGVSQTQFASLKSKNLNITSLKDLGPYTLGAIRDYAYSTDLDAYIKANSKTESKVRLFFGDDPLRLMLRNLEAGRIDVTVEDANVLAHALKTTGGALQIDTRPAGAATPISIGFSPKNAKSATWAKQLGDGTAELRRTGALAPILAKYGVRDWAAGG